MVDEQLEAVEGVDALKAPVRTVIAPVHALDEVLKLFVVSGAGLARTFVVATRAAVAEALAVTRLVAVGLAVAIAVGFSAAGPIAIRTRVPLVSSPVRLVSSLAAEVASALTRSALVIVSHQAPSRFPYSFSKLRCGCKARRPPPEADDIVSTQKARNTRHIK